MSRFLLPVIIASSILTTIIGCGDDPPPVVLPPTGEITVKAVSTPPDTQDIINDPAWNNAEEISLRVGEDANYTDNMGLALVKAKAITDGEYLYMRFSWRDTTLSEKPGYWIYARTPTSPVWTQDLDTAGMHFIIPSVGVKQYEIDKVRWENEDMLAICFDYGNNGSEKANCATSCHYPDTNDVGLSHWPTGGGNIDLWVWRAGRTNPLGLADDEFWTETTRFDGSTVAIYKRNAISSDDISDPIVMHTTGHLYQESFLYSSDTTHVEIGPTWQSMEGIPGYVLERNWNPGGANTSRYDVRAKANFDDVADRWTVVLWRKLQTPNPEEDVTFSSASGSQYQATLAIANHVMRRHSGTKPFVITF